jgi:hypothetical protein
MTTSAPLAARRLLAVCPDEAELLAGVALCKSILSSISLHPDNNVAEARETDFAVLGRISGNRGTFIIFESSGGERRVAVICLTLTTSKQGLANPSEISSAGVLCGRWRITVFVGFTDLGKKVVGEVLAIEVGFDGLEIRHASRDDSCSISCAMELEVFTYHTFSCFCSRISLAADISSIGDGRPGLAGPAVSRGVASVLLESGSISDARSGAKKSRVATSLWGVSTVVHVAFFEFGAVSFVLCRLRLRIFFKSSSCVATDFGVLDWPANVLAFSTAFNSCRATVYVPYRALNKFFPLRTL